MAPKDAEKPKATTKVAVKKADAPKAAAKKTEEAKVEEKVEETKMEVEAEAAAPEAAAAEVPKEPEKPKELEEDAAADTRKKVGAADVALNLPEASLNVLPTMNDKLLMSLSDGGFQYLLAGVRSTAGLKAGRYMFEAKIVESLNPSEPQGTKSPAPKQLVRVGFSTAGSSVFLSETTDYFCFDSEGFFAHGKKRSKAGQKFTFGETVAVLLNLDAKSPNANTVSLFKNGVRASEPQALPEALVGKPLFPTVAYKNVTLQVNFGPKPLVALPFSCRMVKDAAAADVEVVKAPVPKDGKYEVVFPIGMPDEGTFAWADQFLAKNPTFTEISDRKIIEWASRSGLHRQQPQKGSGNSLDAPDMNFGLPLMDDLSVRKLLSVVAPTLNRSFLVMELKANLVAEERREALARFGDFKKVAMVAMGEPSADYKAKVHEDMLTQKKKVAEQAKQKKAREDERKRLFEEKKKKAEEAKKARLATTAKEGEAPAEDEEAKAEDEEKKEEEKKEEEVKPEEPEVLELTEEEKKQWHKKVTTPELSQATLAKFYAKFALPDAADGFDEVKYVWQKEAKCKEILGSWIHERKMTQRVDDLTPGEWFKEQWSKCQKAVQDYRRRQGEWRDPNKRKVFLAKKAADAKKAKAEAKKEAGEEKEGEEAEPAAEEEEAAPMEINVEDLDVFAVEDVTDIGSGEPLFANFVYEDWQLLGYRMEFHLMLHAWKKDVADADRPSFKENHMPFYYNKYFKKQFNLKLFGVEKMDEFIEWIKEAVVVNESTGYFEAQLDEDSAVAEFVKLAEEHRRDRQRRVDAGDETAKLKFQKPQPAQPKQPEAGARPVGPQGGARPASAYAPTGAGLKRPAPSPAGAYGGAGKTQRVGGYPGAPAPGARVGGYGAPVGRPMPGYGAPAPYGHPGGYAPAPTRYAMPPPAGGKGYGGGKGGAYGGGYYRPV